MNNAVEQINAAAHENAKISVSICSMSSDLKEKSSSTVNKYLSL
ncbi:MAG: hypothetical protein ACI37S_02645 [Candidatus Gastranaerophilaceae bacterium]